MGTTALIKLKQSNYDILSSKYDLQGICGKSKVATVFYGIRKDLNCKVAIKQINLKRVLNQTSNINLLLTELQVIKILSRHNFIVNVHSGFHLQTHCYIVQECLTGGDLRDHIRYGEIMSEKSIAYIIACIGSALNHIHKNGIIHRDIKPENIVFDQFFRPKLVDFGISFISNTIIPLSINTSGTLPYVAPEVLAVHHYHSTHSDFWSLGLIAYELIYHQLPFERHCPPEFVSFISNKYYIMWQNVLKYNDKHSFHQVFNNNYNYSNNSNNINNNNNNNIQELPYPIVDDETFTNVTKFPFIDITQPLPSGLKIKLPSTRNFDGKIISDDCLSMLEGLLTILIPQRLGSIHQFELFTNHSWFRTHGFDAFNKLGDLESPLMYEHPYYWQVNHIYDEDINEINEEINNDPIFTPEIKRKLIAYYYGSETYEPISQEEYYPDSLRTGEDKLSQPFSSPIATTPLTVTHQFSQSYTL